ncbi:hypothetical protein F5148DRAFT_1372317 [Russula earlei]|uniref:Uncharacterized protein n=1 Tax=Russula earlei TaxID=71964 RepID=A0ACC0TQF8_9AGAM|nr:hypothetical protein F5148DRAFT_1372317 [Russula earlei]
MIHLWFLGFLGEVQRILHGTASMLGNFTWPTAVSMSDHAFPTGRTRPYKKVPLLVARSTDYHTSDGTSQLKSLAFPCTPAHRASVSMPKSLLPCAARSSTTIGGPSQASSERSPGEHRQDRVTINTLPDDVLLEIFHFYVDQDKRTNGWHTLVHYAGKRPVSEMLDVWPALPVVIDHGSDLSYSWKNIAVALESEHRHRICKIDLWDIPTSEWRRLAAAMQKPFPELTSLQFRVQTTLRRPFRIRSWADPPHFYENSGWKLIWSPPVGHVQT